MNSPTFDADAYKRTTREQWQVAAEPWYRWGPTLEDWLGEATEAMLDMAEVRAGGRVLDVAAGAGGQTRMAARRVGPDGNVLATDISESILAFTEQTAREAGLANVTTRVMDGERLDVPDASFDAVVSRIGQSWLAGSDRSDQWLRGAVRVDHCRRHRRLAGMALGVWRPPERAVAGRGDRGSASPATCRCHGSPSSRTTTTSRSKRLPGAGRDHPAAISSTPARAAAIPSSCTR